MASLTPIEWEFDMDLLCAVQLTAPEIKHMKLQHTLKQIDTKASDAKKAGQTSQAEDQDPTLMLCNIPCSFGREDIVAAIDSCKHCTNLGYAFVHCKMLDFQSDFIH